MIKLPLIILARGRREVCPLGYFCKEKGAMVRQGAGHKAIYYTKKELYCCHHHRQYV